MRDEDIRKAAALLGRKGGKVTGKTKARTGISERMKKWWASPAAAHRRKPKPKVNYAEENYTEENNSTQRSAAPGKTQAQSQSKRQGGS